MNDVPQTLIDAAHLVRQNAYAPYSHYKVGAALEDEDGRIFAGCNVENVSYGASICAERAAIVKMISEGGRWIRSIAVSTADGGTPCGICLQSLLEFAKRPEDLIVYTVSDVGEVESYPLKSLIPNGFSSSIVGS